MWAKLRKFFGQDIQAYWIAPSIETRTRCGVKELFTKVSEYFPDIPVACLHGKMSATEKEEVLMRFADNHTKILVATTIVEVGIDVPNAALIIIENADQLGLAQLHQLRGRVGRRGQKSYCILFYHKPCSAEAKNRLLIMLKSTDGFAIAEEDFKQRGAGNILGNKQSGDGMLRVTSWDKVPNLIDTAREIVSVILADNDTQLITGLIDKWTK